MLRIPHVQVTTGMSYIHIHISMHYDLFCWRSNNSALHTSIKIMVFINCVCHLFWSVTCNIYNTLRKGISHVYVLYDTLCNVMHV